MRYIERKNKIINDKYTEYIYEAFDIQDQDETTVKIPINLGETNTFDWNIGVIYGGSGTGKTTLLKELGDLTDETFKDDIALISNFDWLDAKQATQLLSSMGLGSVPTWLRPYSLLSNGEQYRAMLAYKVGKAKQGDVILIDEFTSVVDRDVAKAMSFALQKYIRRHNKKIVLASCHFDIMEWLTPDWTYSPLKGRVERPSCRRSSRPEIKLQIFRCRYATWDIFKRHHYLSQDLNKAAKCFVLLHNDKPIAFMGILPFPHGSIKNGYRISRIVVLPDYQGLGLGFKIINYFGELYAADNKTLYIKTSNPALFGAMKKNEDKWKFTNGVSKSQLNSEWMEKQQTSDKGGMLKMRNAITKSYKYIGEKSNDSTDVLTFNADAYKDVAQNQISMF
jgi:ABC-type lipoprotein export system ATPase subunit/GNAT superfamily N-acetyltransferase